MRCERELRHPPIRSVRAPPRNYINKVSPSPALPSCPWPPSPPSPPEGRVALWWVDLQHYPSGESEEALLGDAERRRLEGMTNPRSRRRFLATRVALRHLLGASLHCDPAAVTLGLSGHGKPRLEHPSPPLHFNLAHSGEIALIAISPLGEVGVDLELYHRRREVQRVARRFFSGEEASVVAERGEPAFLSLWVRKEALLKAHGRGIALGLRRAGGLPLEEAEIRVELEDEGKGGEWTIRELRGIPGVAIAVAHAGGRMPELALWRLSPEERSGLAHR